jgi:hypothetical protein
MGADSLAQAAVIEVFLDWAWRNWEHHRPWDPPGKVIEPPHTDSARDDCRLVFRLKPTASFLIGVRPEARTVRIGLVTTNRWISEGIEQAVLDHAGGSMTEFLEDEMEADDDLEHPMLHYHDSGEFYFISEIPFEDLHAPELYGEVSAYFQGYVVAFENRLEEE